MLNVELSSNNLIKNINRKKNQYDRTLLSKKRACTFDAKICYPRGLFAQRNNATYNTVYIYKIYAAAFAK